MGGISSFVVDLRPILQPLARAFSIPERHTNGSIPKYWCYDERRFAPPLTPPVRYAMMQSSGHRMAPLPALPYLISTLHRFLAVYTGFWIDPIGIHNLVCLSTNLTRHIL